jgi:hypothetical protein
LPRSTPLLHVNNSATDCRLKGTDLEKKYHRWRTEFNDIVDPPIRTRKQATVEMMRRWEMDGIGRNRLELREAPIPKPGRGEVLVKVTAVSLNFRDKLVIESGVGLPLAFPFTPCSDGRGGRPDGPQARD